MKKFTIAGLDVVSGSVRDVVAQISQWIDAGIHTYICVTGANGVVEANRTPLVLQAHQKAGLVVPDGMPLVWIGKAIGFIKSQRIYGPDLFLAVCRRAQDEKWSIFFYGCTTRVLVALSQKLRERFPKLIIAGVYAPPFRALTKSESKNIVQMINISRAQIVFVGLSTPKQELWMDAHSKKLHANVLLGVGAAFDFIAGTKKQAPLWVQRAGLEWLFRLFQEPKRLWYRSTVINIHFLILIYQDIKTRFFREYFGKIT